MLKMKKGSFEGWYFKHQIGDRVFSFIVSFHTDEHEQECAYIQFVTNEGSFCEKFDIEDCYVNLETFHIKIGGNRFGRTGCRVNIKSNGLEVACNIRYGEFTKIPSDIMGPFAKVPSVPCKHSILSMIHDLHGFIDINDEAIELTGGTGYIEGDSGASFPKSYMWTQCNFRFKGDHSIMLACAEIPVLLGGFEGIICQILYRGKQYRLATYKGAKIIQKTDKSIGIKQGDMRVYVMALEEGGHLLQVPHRGEMTEFVHENPAGRVRYVFYKNEKKIFDFVSRCGSFECFHGN
ncbi:MAG: tocopherol cyclase family protein [Eubacteriales bacterium]